MEKGELIGKLSFFILIQFTHMLKFTHMLNKTLFFNMFA